MSDSNTEDAILKLFRVPEGTFTSAMEEDLREALYAYGEMIGWEDYVDSVSSSQAILLWSIVEFVRNNRFPKELRP